MHGSLIVSLDRGSMMTTPFSIASMVECKGDTPLNILVIKKLMALKVDPKSLGIHSMVDATPPVLLWGLFQVHSKLSNRTVRHDLYAIAKN